MSIRLDKRGVMQQLRLLMRRADVCANGGIAVVTADTSFVNCNTTIESGLPHCYHSPGYDLQLQLLIPRTWPHTTTLVEWHLIAKPCGSEIKIHPSARSGCTRHETYDTTTAFAYHLWWCHFQVIITYSSNRHLCCAFRILPAINQQMRLVHLLALCCASAVAYGSQGAFQTPQCVSRFLKRTVFARPTLL
jgi:hypothetical protein